MKLLLTFLLCCTLAAQISPTSKTCINQVTSGSSVTCTWSSSPAAGESIFVYAQGGNNTVTSFSVSDSHSNTYTADGSIASPTGNPFQAFHFFNLPTSITTTTVTFNTSNPFPLIMASSATGNMALDLTGNGRTTWSTGAFTITSLTTTGKDWVVCGGGANSGTTTISAGSGFTGGSSQANFMNEWLVQSAAGSISPTFAFSGSSAIVQGWCSAYKPVSTSHPHVFPILY